jgi:hypothetical protein
VTSHSDDGSAWRDLAINALTGAVAVLAAVIYGILALAYSKFYAELGVRPADAGVEFGAGLAGSAGLTFFIVVMAAALTGVGVAVWRVTRPLRRRAPSTLLTKDVTPRVAVQAGAAMVGLVGVVFVLRFIIAADQWADRVKRGEPVEPLSFAKVEVLGARADLVQVEAVGDGTESTKLQALEKRSRQNPELLYLGRSSTHVLLYDSQLQRTVQIPSGSVVVTAFNCETKLSTDPACQRLRNGDH